MRQLVDLTGKRYGMLTVIRHHLKDKRNAHFWLCKCDCGNVCTRKSGSLVDGRTNSCGCRRMNRERTILDQRISRLQATLADLLAKRESLKQGS